MVRPSTADNRGLTVITFPNCVIIFEMEVQSDLYHSRYLGVLNFGLKDYG